MHFREFQRAVSPRWLPKSNRPSESGRDRASRRRVSLDVAMLEDRRLLSTATLTALGVSSARADLRPE